MLYKDFVREKVNNEIRIKSAEGYPCVFDNSKGRPLKDYKIYGNSIQDGTPTPESPVEIQSVGDYTTKNLINESAITLSSGYWSDSSGNQINNNSRLIRISSVKCNPNETYTLSSNLKIYTIWFFNNDTPISKTYRENMVATIKTPENCNRLRISLVNTSGNTDTIAFKWIQLELGSAATEYEPYGKYKIPVTVRGKNLIKYPYSQTTKTENGITFTDNGDGTITVDGTATADIYFFLQRDITLSSGTYIMSGCPTGGSTTTYFIGFGASVNADIGNGVVRTLPKDTTMNLFIRILNGTAVSNIIFKPQLELGAVATAYEQYREPITTHIYLDEPLRKIGDYADYIDFKNQKVVRNIKKVTLNGSETWALGKPILENTIPFSIKPNDMLKLEVKYSVLSDRFITRSSGMSSVDIEFVQHSGYLIFFKINKSRLNGETVSDMKSWLSVNNTQIYYILSTPVEESIIVPGLKTVKGTSIMSVNTIISPSNIKAKYVRM